MDPHSPRTHPLCDRSPHSHKTKVSHPTGGGEPSLDRVYDEFHWEFRIRSAKYGVGEGEQLSDN